MLQCGDVHVCAEMHNNCQKNYKLQIFHCMYVCMYVWCVDVCIY